MKSSHRVRIKPCHKMLVELGKALLGGTAILGGVNCLSLLACGRSVTAFWLSEYYRQPARFVRYETELPDGQSIGVTRIYNAKGRVLAEGLAATFDQTVHLTTTNVPASAQLMAELHEFPDRQVKTLRAISCELPQGYYRLVGTIFNNRLSLTAHHLRHGELPWMFRIAVMTAIAYAVENHETLRIKARSWLSSATSSKE